MSPSTYTKHFYAVKCNCLFVYFLSIYSISNLLADLSSKLDTMYESPFIELIIGSGVLLLICLIINVAQVPPSSFRHFPFTIYVYLVQCLCTMVCVRENLHPSSDEHFWVPNVTINQVLQHLFNFVLGIKPSNSFYYCLRLAEAIIAKPSIFLSQPFCILMTV